MQRLKFDVAGRTGPVSAPAVWTFWCGSECSVSDEYHLRAMDWTGCSCLELSTQADSPLYRFEGDFCRENSGRLLCDILGICGVWGCALDDFMCPAHEMRRNKLTGYGSYACGAAPAAAKQGAAAILAATAAMFVARRLFDGS